MKKTIWLLVIACVISFNLQAQELPNESMKLDFDRNYPLYTSDQAKFNYNEVEKALDQVYSSQLPVVVFVHGRGNEPKKSLDKGTFVEGGAVKKFELHYKVKILMFNWESKAFLQDRSVPLSKMKTSADSLNLVLQKLKEYFYLRPQLKRPVLLAHSMGSIVVENLVKSYGWFPGSTESLFANVVFTSPDTDNASHWEWIEEIGKKENVYITVNQKDDILEKSTDSRAEGSAALGLVPMLPFSERVKYLDTSGLIGGVHEIFNKEKMKSQVFLCEIATRILTGIDPQLSSKNSKVTDFKNYLKIKSQIKESDPCFIY